ncbi:MAG: YgiW/YdeI family stress tolerance OB fold protein [Vibrio sp.]|uniref:YgiW/YdeI family stress tolerance OB fold protein n=1 Tax=Vibrio sp. TaxID=678 RepID=UPI003A8A8245
MKKYILSAVITIAISTPALANNGGFSGQTVTSGGFSGPTHGITTVQQVLDSGMFSDDTPVVLTGYIKASLGKDKYLFTDETGTVTVEIDHKKWLGQTVTPDTKIQLIGEIDKEISKVKVDVDAIRVL